MTAFGSSHSSTMVLAILIGSKETCSPWTTRSARGCHLCLRYVSLPMSPGWTIKLLATASNPRVASRVVLKADLEGQRHGSAS